MLTNMQWSKSLFKKQFIWLIPIIALLALIVLMKVSGSGQTLAPPVKAKNHIVEVVPVQWQQQYSQKRLVTGQVEAPQTAAIGFELAGSLKTLLFEEGQEVIQGQVLAELDKQSLLAQMNELSAMQKRATAEANLAELSLKRVVELVAKNLESAQRLDESEQSRNMASAFVEELSARKQRLEVELSKTQLIAPFDGSIVTRLVDHGSVVSPGQTVFRLQQNSQLDARFAMPANYAQQFPVGGLINLIAGSERIEGQIKSISGIRRLDTRTIDVMVNITGQTLSLLPGDLINVELSSDITTSGVWVPRNALVSGVRGLWSLFVAEPSELGHTLIPKLVEIIHSDEKNAYVRGALKNDDMIVVSGMQRLVPGQLVELRASQLQPTDSNE